jgi:hypothetical protein
MTRSSAISIQTFSISQHLTSYNLTMNHAFVFFTTTYSTFLFFYALNTAGFTGYLGGYKLSM